MDTGLLNLGEEHFGTFSASFDDYSPLGSFDRPHYETSWEDEREELGLVPVPRNFDDPMRDIPRSPPQEPLIDWSSFINLDVVHEGHYLPENIVLSPPQEVLDESKSFLKFEEDVEEDFQEISNFDLATYINEPDVKPVIHKAPVKKIDLVAQKYIVEEPKTTIKNEIASEPTEDIDIETVYEPSSMPVLEASDAFGLLEQFEATEKPNFNIERVPETLPEIFYDEPVKVEAAPVVKIEKKQVVKKKAEKKVEKPKEYVKNKQILEALPQELIKRINESGKRKTITVIPPIPNKKRGASKSVDSIAPVKTKVPKLNTSDSVSNNKSVVNVNNNVNVGNIRVQLDHDYCSLMTPYPKEPVKDSGFESGEDDERAIIRNQPTVKNADGKLMVSLLKVNTIRSNDVALKNQKKKLNLEEYKKRRSINSNTTSQSNSPSSSSCSSPLHEEKPVKPSLTYQEKMNMMMEGVLNTPPSHFKKNEAVLSVLKQTPAPAQKEVPRVPLPEVKPPPHMDRLVFVSAGTNTDITEDVRSLSQLEDIGPLLKKASHKINSSSLITSLIENLPQVKGLSEKKAVNSEEVFHENKVIVYLPKNRPAVEKCSVKVQTVISMTEQEVPSRYRRRMERSPSSTASTSSGSSYSGGRSSSSRHSHSSRRDSSSSSSFCSRTSTSRSRSRSCSPKRSKYSPEYIREVEERRVVYVGRLTKTTTHDDLRKRFQRFGQIKNIKINRRDDGDPYGFVTFAKREDAYQAVEHGNDGYVHPKYDLSFGGRRLFCQTTYSDLDNVHDDEFGYGYRPRPKTENSTFDTLLKEFQSMRKRKP